MAGDVPEAVQARARGEHPTLWLTFQGVVPRAQIPGLDRSAHLFYAAEINPPCPNSVIEALACGLPVVGFATGSMPELIRGDAGRLAPYGGDPWRLEQPDFQALARAAAEIAAGGERFRRAARERAEQAFDLDGMVAAYLRALAG